MALFLAISKIAFMFISSDNIQSFYIVMLRILDDTDSEVKYAKFYFVDKLKR